VSGTTASTDAFLKAAYERARGRFVEEKSLLSFGEYLAVVAQDAARQARDAAVYLRDCFLYYGTQTVVRPYGRFTRYSLFDAPFDDGRDPLLGHERVQEAVFGLLSDFVQDGRVNKLILLHGPNGSAKTSLIGCIVRALEDYSRQPEGALYTFNWVFPSKKTEHGSIGFGSGGGTSSLDTFAHLPVDAVDARLRCETRDHPLLLLPREDRLRFLRKHLPEGARIPDNLTEGELSAKPRAIFDALLRAHHGDLAEVLRHIQIERFYISRRYRHAAVTIDPQMRVDAGVRQVTQDRSHSALPPSLQTITLFEPVGDLVDANRGIIEYNDLLKRPLEAFKYLLATCEKGTASVDLMTLYLDTVYIGSSNATHLNAFKEIPDFASFKARIELVQVPYLVDFPAEARIYEEQTSAALLKRPVAPHTAETAALWAVLTRLMRATPERYPEPVRKVLEGLTPMEKAQLYAFGRTPAGLSRDVANGLRGQLSALFAERNDAEIYEGRFGASPREIKAALLGAARRSDLRCVSPVGLLDELEDLCKRISEYEFLRLEPDGGYHQPRAFIDQVREWYLRVVEEELHAAMGLVDKTQTAELFRRYVDDVVCFVRKEKRKNPHTGRYEDPDEKLMRDVEQKLGLDADKAADARAGVMHRIGAWRMDNPDAPLDYDVIFADRLERLRDAFYQEKKQVADRVKRNLLRRLVEEDVRLSADDEEQVNRTLEALERDFGYCRACAVDVIGYLLKHRNRKG